MAEVEVTAEAPSAAAPMASRGVCDRAGCMTFLFEATKRMESEETRAELRDVKNFGKKMIEMQRACWDPLGVDRDLGSRFLAEVEKNFPGDAELADMKFKFVKCCTRTYIKILEDKKPEKLERKKPMPKETIMEFFTACNMKMDLPETLSQLITAYETTKIMPNQMIIDWQRQMLETLGYEANHGCEFLGKVGSEFFKGDKELGSYYNGWKHKAEETLSKAVHIVQVEQASAGVQNAPGDEVSPEEAEMAKLRKRAEQELQKMSHEEKQALVQKQAKRIEVFSRLAADARLEYMKKQTEDDKLSMIKTQILLVAQMRAQYQCPAHVHVPGSDAKAAAQAAASSALPAAGKPSQQQMM